MRALLNRFTLTPVHRPTNRAVEIMAFMGAADQSNAKGSASVSLAEVLAKARAEAALKLRTRAERR